MLALPQSHLFTAKYGHDVHFDIVGIETKENKKERKKTYSRRQKNPTFRRRWRTGNKHAHKKIILGGGLIAQLPDPILEGLRDSLLTATDRYSYTVSVPQMYNIVGRKGVEALHSQAWDEAREDRRKQ